MEAVGKANGVPLHHLAKDADLWIDLWSDSLLRYQAGRLEDNEGQLNFIHLRVSKGCPLTLRLRAFCAVPSSAL